MFKGRQEQLWNLYSTCSQKTFLMFFSWFSKVEILMGAWWQWCCSFFQCLVLHSGHLDLTEDTMRSLEMLQLFCFWVNDLTCSFIVQRCLWSKNKKNVHRKKHIYWIFSSLFTKLNENISRVLQSLRTIRHYSHRMSNGITVCTSWRDNDILKYYKKIWHPLTVI